MRPIYINNHNDTNIMLKINVLEIKVGPTANYSTAWNRKDSSFNHGRKEENMETPPSPTLYIGKGHAYLPIISY